jgi:ribosomal protein S27AE
MEQEKAVCPRCGSMRLKRWEDLARDEQIAAERLPSSAQFTVEHRKKHRFCTRCWYETAELERRV